MAKKESAEEKLLKMIETSEGSDAASFSVPKKRVRKSSQVGFVKGINILLMLGILGAVLFLANEIWAGMQLSKKNIEVSVDGRFSKAAFSAPEVPELRDLSGYISRVNNRNIFQPFQEKSSVQAVESQPQDDRILKEVGKLRLVGISWMDRVDTASVMLEDTEKNITYFLNKGQKVGDIFVKTIYADSVELGYENEEIIIKYDTPQM